MFDSANAALWSNSLMWAVLAFMVVSPALVFLSTPSEEASRSTARRKDFVDNESEEDRRLWPKSEQNADSNETKQSVRAGA